MRGDRQQQGVGEPEAEVERPRQRGGKRDGPSERLLHGRGRDRDSGKDQGPDSEAKRIFFSKEDFAGLASEKYCSVVMRRHNIKPQVVK